MIFIITCKVPCSSGAGEEHGVLGGPCFGLYPGAGLTLTGVTARWGGCLRKSMIRNRLLLVMPPPFASLPKAFPRFPRVSSYLGDEGYDAYAYFLVNPGGTVDLRCTSAQVEQAHSAKLNVCGFSEARELWPLGTAWTPSQKLGSGKALTTPLTLTYKNTNDLLS